MAFVPAQIHDYPAQLSFGTKLFKKRSISENSFRAILKNAAITTNYGNPSRSGVFFPEQPQTIFSSAQKLGISSPPGPSQNPKPHPAAKTSSFAHPKLRVELHNQPKLLSSDTERFPAEPASNSNRGLTFHRRLSLTKTCSPNIAFPRNSSGTKRPNPHSEVIQDRFVAEKTAEPDLNAVYRVAKNISQTTREAFQQSNELLRLMNRSGHNCWSNTENENKLH